MKSQVVVDRTSPSDAVVSRPVFFGDSRTPLFGLLTFPASRSVVGGVLVCPSLGKEQAETTRGLKMLADRLADSGFVVLRFDYACTGESAGAQDDPTACDRWLHSIGEGIEYLRHTGVDNIDMVAHRAGALLATQLPDVLGSVESLVLWDPVDRGSAFIRAKAVLYNMISDDDGTVPGPRPPRVVDEDPQHVHVAGHSLDLVAAAALKSLRADVESVTAARPDKESTIVVSASDSMRSKFVDRFRAAGIEVVDGGDMSAFLGPTHPAYLHLPESTIIGIVEWLRGRSGTTRRPISVDDGPSASATVAHTPAGDPIDTRVYVLDDGVTMVWDTAIRDTHDTATQVFVGHSLGQYIRTGPGRLWWETALNVAARGGRGIRFDRPDVGESPSPTSAVEGGPLYTKAAIARCLSILPLLERLPTGSHVVHAGICVGSWASAHVALAHADRGSVARLTSSVVLVNSLMWRLRPFQVEALIDDVGIGGLPVDVDTPRLRTRVAYKLSAAGSKVVPHVRRLPAVLRTSVEKLPFVQMPELMIGALVRRGVGVTLVFSPRDNARFSERLGGDDALRAAQGPVKRYVASHGDHTSYWQVPDNRSSRS